MRIKLKDGNLRDEIWHPVYDTVILEGGQNPVGSYSFFTGVAGKPACATNMRQNSMFESSVSYRVTGFKMDAQNLDSRNSDVLALIMESSGIRFQIGEKTYYEANLAMVCGRLVSQQGGGFTNEVIEVPWHSDPSLRPSLYELLHFDGTGYKPAHSSNDPLDEFGAPCNPVAMCVGINTTKGTNLIALRSSTLTIPGHGWAIGSEMFLGSHGNAVPRLHSENKTNQMCFTVIDANTIKLAGTPLGAKKSQVRLGSASSSAVTLAQTHSIEIAPLQTFKLDWEISPHPLFGLSGSYLTRATPVLGSRLKFTMILRGLMRRPIQ